MSESKRKIVMGISDLALEEFIKIIKALGNEDSMNIFLHLENGITSSKENLKLLGITQKRFYSRIKDLLEIGLIEKREGKYKLTQLGKILINMIKKVEPILTMKEKLKIIDEMENLGYVNEEKKLDFLKTIFPDEIINIISEDEALIIKILDFDCLRSEMLVEIEKSKQNIYLMSKYYDFNVAKILVEKIESNVEILYIMEEVKIENAKKILSILLSPNSIKTLYNFLSKYNKNIKVVDKIVNSFMVVDDEIAIIEVPNPFNGSFLFAVKIKDKNIAETLKGIFFHIWEKGKIFPYI